MSRSWGLLLVAWLAAGIGCVAHRTGAHDAPGEAGPCGLVDELWANRHQDLDAGERERLAEEHEKELAEANRNEEKKNGNGEGENGDEDKKNGGFQPKHIRDNGFLVDEAYNQGTGEVQHIFNWINSWTRTPFGRNRDFEASYCMELPLGSQAHQFSFTIFYQTAFEQTDAGPAVQSGDIGDSLLSYRYQLFASDDTFWCAPQFTLVVPTGDERFGFGNGALGYDFLLPVSFYRERFDFHLNAGYSTTPGARSGVAPGVLSPKHTLQGYVLGAALYWKPEVFLHFFIEALWQRNDIIDELGFRDNESQVYINPGVRYAITQNEGVEWVLGVAAPIGLTEDTPDISVFAYMSIEYDFRNPKK
ncbi:MAG: hypothetical protein JNM56_38575 [Planctomycetia bacterium]|nr:hypothetical protein [Planctomycetia bacterium]